MSPPLARVLVAKVAMTACIWVAPLLCFPVSWLEALGFPVPEPVLFLRLLGMAYAALVVGYCAGLRELGRGDHPATVLRVGLVSNGGACLLLAWYGMAGAWAGWGWLARATMWTSLAATGGIAWGLWHFGLRPAVARPAAPARGR